MRYHGALLCLAAFATSCLALPAAAQTASATFDVTLTIPATCTINTPAAANVAFPSSPSTATNIDAIGQLNVNCPPAPPTTSPSTLDCTQVEAELAREP